MGGWVKCPIGNKKKLENIFLYIILLRFWASIRTSIGLYRDVWIAAIASSTTSLATRTAAICVRFHGRRVRRGYVTMQITFLTRKSALIYRRGLRQRVASLTLNCNGDLAIRAYNVINALQCRCSFFYVQVFVVNYFWDFPDFFFLDRGVGGWGVSYPNFFWIFIYFLYLQGPLVPI